MLGHKNPKTFERNYIAHTSMSDIQSLSQAKPERLDTLRTLARLSSRRDSRTPNKLPPDRVAMVVESDELKELDEELRTADASTASQIKNAKRWRKEKLLEAELKSYRKEWSEAQDYEYGLECDDQFTLEIPSHALELQRHRVATALFGSQDPIDEEALLRDLVKLCESRGKKASTSRPPAIFSIPLFPGAEQRRSMLLRIQSSNHDGEETSAPRQQLLRSSPAQDPL
jgi:hypothetical protein